MIIQYILTLVFLKIPHSGKLWKENLHLDLLTHFILGHSSPLTLSLIIVYGYNLLHRQIPLLSYLPTASKDWPLSACNSIRVYRWWTWFGRHHLKTNISNEKRNISCLQVIIPFKIFTKLICIYNLNAERCLNFPFTESICEAAAESQLPWWWLATLLVWQRCGGWHKTK